MNTKDYTHFIEMWASRDRDGNYIPNPENMILPADIEELKENLNYTKSLSRFKTICVFLIKEKPKSDESKNKVA